MSHEIRLTACNPTSLMGYMKGLGAFSVLSQQFDSNLRMHWEDSLPCLSFSKRIDRSVLAEFFVGRAGDIQSYRPTPIVIPWSGKDFFEASTPGNPGPFSKPPTERGIVEAFLAIKSPRLDEYRNAIRIVLKVIGDMDLTKDAIDSKTSAGKARKAEFMAVLRSTLPDRMVDVLDVAALIGVNSVVTNTMLGSGGGNDGRLHFGGNFMQCLWLCLPDFEKQRDLAGEYIDFNSTAACRHSIFGGELGEKVAILNDTPGLYSPGGVGGPNAFEGFEAESLRNPWEFILTLEGVTLFAGALSRRSGTQGAGYLCSRPSFPFTCRLSYDGASSLILSETDNREVWLPIWRRPALLKSLRILFAEGRAEISRRQARNGIDFARAIASLGIDRGISEFKRYAIVRGRVGGENYHTAVEIGSMHTRHRPLEHIRLLDDIDSWLNKLRGKCSDENTAQRYGAQLRSIDASIYSCCKHGTTLRLQRVLRSLGRAERAFASAGQDRPVPPLTHLSPRWIGACDDGSTEYRIASSLASIYDQKIGPIRTHMEPVTVNKGRLSWVDKRNAVAWGGGSLQNNLAQVLQRRMMEGIQKGCHFTPIMSRVSAGLIDVHRLMMNRIDDHKVADLLWGLMMIRWQDYNRDQHRPSWQSEPAPEISPIYALLKLSHLPGRLYLRQANKPRWEVSYQVEEGIRIPVSLELIQLLRAGRVHRAVSRGVHRLRALGLYPLGSIKGRKYVPDIAVEPGEASRVAGALLVPVWEIDSLARRVLRTPEKETGELGV